MLLGIDAQDRVLYRDGDHIGLKPLGGGASEDLAIPPGLVPSLVAADAAAPDRSVLLLRSFDPTAAWIFFNGLRAIAVRDHKELRVAIDYKMVKSTAIIAGSVVEAVPFDRLLQAGETVASLEHKTLAVSTRSRRPRRSSLGAAMPPRRRCVRLGISFTPGSSTGRAR